MANLLIRGDRLFLALEFLLAFPGAYEAAELVRRGRRHAWDSPVPLPRLVVRKDFGDEKVVMSGLELGLVVDPRRTEADLKLLEGERAWMALLRDFLLPAADQLSHTELDLEPFLESSAGELRDLLRSVFQRFAAGDFSDSDFQKRSPQAPERLPAWKPPLRVRAS